MSGYVLKELDVTNFRSIRGHVHAPLDAKVVLIHGENGAGKTSLLSAIELALTGGVQSLHRADPNYVRQLLHRTANDGSVVLKAVEGSGERTFKAILDEKGAQSVASLDASLAGIFRERTFLPQSLLGQLLQIYQEAGSDSDSPLAKFVGKLLGLDRLDALEAGLKPLVDVRNVRKVVDGWLAAENEKSRIDRLVTDQRKTRAATDESLKTTLSELGKLCTTLELGVHVSEETLEVAASALGNAQDSDAFERLSDQRRRLGAIRREIEQAAIATQNEPQPPVDSSVASAMYASWEGKHGARLASLRTRVEILLPDLSVPSDPAQFGQEALGRLRAEHKQLADRVAQARIDLERHNDAQGQREIALKQRDIIDEEVGRLSSSAGSLGSALAELTSFIADDTCPVCDRDYRELEKGSLGDHVHSKIRALSASAERLLTLGRSRSEVQLVMDRLEREIQVLSARELDARALADLDRRAANVEDTLGELEAMVETLREGSRLRADDIAARRAVSDAQSRHVSLAASRETLSAFALSIGAPSVAEGEAFAAAAARLEELLASESVRLERRLSMRREGIALIATLRAGIVRRKEIDASTASDMAAWIRTEGALERAQKLRDQGLVIRNTVDQVRSAIIRREFNDRLNRVWRDLFVRLAPGEPFVPAFRIPSSSTQRLQPKLITEHRDGGEAGGTPGAMLSAGNLNTAALTLFIALHLSAPMELPWLILDDPVQSMDDVHIAHFAALLRTLSKEHGRQVMIAVHDRQLFEYLKLELSPAFQDDSLLTLELSRGPRRDSMCISQRFAYKEETALLVAAA